jgi:probable rRNA maturation factor
MPETKPVLPLVSFHFLKGGFTLSDRVRLKGFIAVLFKKEKKPAAELRYVFCSDEYLLQINRQFLHHDFYTDIITFDLAQPPAPVNGEIYISVDRVRDNAQQFGNSFKNELHRVIFHGALHLCGYKDKGDRDEQKMRKMEDKYIHLYFL